MVLIDTHAGDGLGVPQPQRSLCFDEQDSDDEESLPSPQVLAKIYRQTQSAAFIACENNKERRQSLIDVMSRIAPSAMILNSDRDLLRINFRQWDHALIISDPCGVSERKNGRGRYIGQGHHVEILRYINSHIKTSDTILTLNMGALDRMYGVGGETEEGDSPQTLGLRVSVPNYLWMANPLEWATRLGRRYAARSPLICQSNGYKFHLIVIANYFASCINRRWEIYKGGNNGSC